MPEVTGMSITDAKKALKKGEKLQIPRFLLKNEQKDAK